MVENLKMLRLSKGLSQKALGELVGVSQQSINKYENHLIEPDISTLKNMADLFETSIDFLIGHTDINHRIEPTDRFDLNDEEARFLTAFRSLSRERRTALLALIESMLS